MESFRVTIHLIRNRCLGAELIIASIAKLNTVYFPPDCTSGYEILGVSFSRYMIVPRIKYFSMGCSLGI
jgi:hypothetical protein